jgi:hypothetical protein
MTVTKDQFRRLFEQVLERAAKLADVQLGRSIPRSFRIQLHVLQYSGQEVDLNTATDALFLAEDRFYRIIDVSVVSVRPTESVVFVRASGHPPCAFSETWDANDQGPFKQLGASIRT